MIYKFFDKKTSDGIVKSQIMPNQSLAEELHKPIVTTFEKRKVYSSFKGNILGADLGNMLSICKNLSYVKINNVNLKYLMLKLIV